MSQIKVGSIFYDSTCKNQNIYLIILKIDDEKITYYRFQSLYSYTTTTPSFTLNTLNSWQIHNPSLEGKKDV